MQRGRGLRLPRRQRRRQDDRDSHADRPARRRAAARRASPATTSTRESEAIKRSIGYMSQRFSLYEDLTAAREHPPVRRHLRPDARSRFASAPIAMLRASASPHVADEPVRSLPLGWRQKLAFSVALLHEPRIVFLDEPTSGVDPITRRQFWELIYEAAARGHDRAGHDALHGRGGVLRSHLDHGRRPHRGDRHAGGSEAAVRRRLDRRVVRPARPAGAVRPSEAAQHERAQGTAAQGERFTSCAIAGR